MAHPFPTDAAMDPNLPHDSMATHIVGVCSAMLILVTLVIGARFWVRFKIVKGKAGADDWYILVAWVFAVTFDLCTIKLTKTGLGRHFYDLPPETNFNASLELYYFTEVVYTICVAVTKIAILTLYLRLAVQRTFRRILWGCVIFVVACVTAFVLACLFQCNPIHKAWDAAGTVPGSCINLNAIGIANAGLDIFQDAVIYVLPMRMLYQIHLPPRQKTALMGVFAVGGFVVITGIIRLNSVKLVQNSQDANYKNYAAAVWSAIECSVGVVCACLPMFKALIDRFFPTLLGYNRSFGRNAPPEGSATGERSHGVKINGGDLELQHDLAWKDSSYTSDYGGNSHNYSAAAEGNLTFHAISSEEHLRVAEADKAKNGGIWRFTSMVVSRSQV